jgi:hypothetical protein
MKRYFLFLALHVSSTLTFGQNDTSLLRQLMATQPEQFGSFLKDPSANRIQIIYTQIDRDKNNIPHFKEFTYRLNPDEYFYPASTVKFPLSVLALEKLNNLNIKGLDKTTKAVYDSANSRQQQIYNNPYAQDGRQNIEQAIKEILLVSSNDAANRLYEFLGQKYIHDQLASKGYPNVYIRNRLDLGRTADENRHTPLVSFYDDSDRLVYQQPPQYNTDPLPNYNVFLDKAYYNNKDSLIHAPFDFSIKNRISLSDLHHIMQSVIFYDQTPTKQRFNLSLADRQFLLKWMRTLPYESIYPTYDTTEYWDTYRKFVLMGSEKVPMPKHIKIFNKEGDAYGFLLDNAYVVDTLNKVEFMLSAVIYCNSDGIQNDNKYDYDSVGFPFYKHIGELVYQYELQRKKNYLPNFDSLLNY